MRRPQPPCTTPSKCLTALSVKNFFLTSILSPLSFSLKPLPHVLSLTHSLGPDVVNPCPLLDFVCLLSFEVLPSLNPCQAKLAHLLLGSKYLLTQTWQRTEIFADSQQVQWCCCHREGRRAQEQASHGSFFTARLSCVYLVSFVASSWSL